jgi:hypothetical protein
VVLGQGGHDLGVTDNEGWVDALRLDELANELGGQLDVAERERLIHTLSRSRALVLGSLQSTLCCDVNNTSHLGKTTYLLTEITEELVGIVVM